MSRTTPDEKPQVKGQVSRLSRLSRTKLNCWSHTTTTRHEE